MFTDNKSMADSFGSHGMEGMLDVVLGCTLIFLLMSSLISVSEVTSQEKMLPAVNISQSKLNHIGAERVKKNIISLRQHSGQPEIFFDNEQVSLAELKKRLQQLSGLGAIALRRDRNLTCNWEDKIIMLCRNSGIKRVAIVIRTKK